MGWSGHSVHHSGEDYNLATALRQGALQPLFGGPFYAPMAWLGYPPQAFAAHEALNTLYMFWIHTELVDRLPFGLEYVFNSPMAHRMHHRPPGNCNYAGFLIVWDRLFGTYVPELERRDLYGNGDQPNSFNTLSLNLHHWKRILRLRRPHFFSRRVQWRWQCSLAALSEPIPPSKDRRSEGPVRAPFDGERAARPAGEAAAHVAMSAATLLGSFAVILTAKDMALRNALMSSGLSLAACASVTHLMDRRTDESPLALPGALAVILVFFRSIAVGTAGPALVAA